MVAIRAIVERLARNVDFSGFSLDLTAILADLFGFGLLLDTRSLQSAAP